ncbi:hypothetical protein Bca4012_034944 [Brassica carinata]
MGRSSTSLPRIFFRTISPLRFKPCLFGEEERDSSSSSSSTLRFDLRSESDDNLVQQWPQKRKDQKKRERKVERRESSSMLLLLRVAYVFNGQRNKEMSLPLVLSIYSLLRFRRQKTSSPSSQPQSFSLTSFQTLLDFQKEKCKQSNKESRY